MSVGKRLILEKAKNGALTARMDEMRAEQAVKLATDDVRIADLQVELSALRARLAPAPSVAAELVEKLEEEIANLKKSFSETAACLAWERAHEYLLPKPDCCCAACNLNRKLALLNWQPIETAPKDGTEILVLFDSATVDVVRLCWWNDGGELMNGMKPDPEAVGWWSYIHSVTQEQIDMPAVAWMPMPKRDAIRALTPAAAGKDLTS